MLSFLDIKMVTFDKGTILTDDWRVYNSTHGIAIDSSTIKQLRVKTHAIAVPFYAWVRDRDGE